MKKTKTTKRALLMSGLALLLCVSMLVGSTYAWFTDSVSTAGTTIQSGTLQVDLVNGAGESLEGKAVKFADLDQNSLWEPGCTYETEPVFVKNNGTLALKYTLGINGINGDAKLLEAIEWSAKVDGAEVSLSALTGSLKAGETSKAIVLIGHMREDAGNEYQGLVVEGISFTVFATQLTYESDSNGPDYDANARLDYTYDTSKSAKENAAALQALIDTAVEGTTIVASAGTYDVSGISGNQIKLAKNGLTLLGMPGAIVNDDGEAGSTNSTNTQAVIRITGDNVTVSGISATDKGTNTVILVSGNNVTVNNCTLKGFAEPNWGQYLEAGIMIVANDVVNHPITKYTVTNNTFIDCNLSLQNGAGNGGVAKDLIVSGNTFKNAGVFIEHNQTNSVTGAVESWHVTDILVLPTIKNNLFESPSVWLSGNTPFAMYVRVYRDNDVATMTPASYWTDFVANNTIMDYTGEKVSNDGSAALTGKNGVQMRPNGKVQYYGLTFGTTASNVAALTEAFADGGEIVLTNDIVVENTTLNVAKDKDVTLDLNGKKLSGVNTADGTSALIKNSGTLTITGNGTISVLAENPDTNWDPEGFPTYASNTIANSGNLTIEDGVKIENQTAKGGASYAIDNYAGATLTVNGGEIIQSGGDVAIRMNTASATAENKVTINGGTISGRRAIWIHLAGSSNATAPKITLEINGGNLSGTQMCIYSYSYGNSFANTNVTINGGTFNGDVQFGGGYKGDQETVVVTGGTFNGAIGRWTAGDVFQPLA
ncbi:MAG: hypothetical protein IJC84_06380 [Clostridia bacterium]|nr:hypothetical protein [Clostridia bacterium]